MVRLPLASISSPVAVCLQMGGPVQTSSQKTVHSSRQKTVRMADPRRVETWYNTSQDLFGLTRRSHQKHTLTIKVPRTLRTWRASFVPRRVRRQPTGLSLVVPPTPVKPGSERESAAPSPVYHHLVNLSNYNHINLGKIERDQTGTPIRERSGPTPFQCTLRGPRSRPGRRRGGTGRPALLCAAPGGSCHLAARPPPACRPRYSCSPC